MDLPLLKMAVGLHSGRLSSTVPSSARHFLRRGETRGRGDAESGRPGEKGDEDRFEFEFDGEDEFEDEGEDEPEHLFVDSDLSAVQDGPGGDLPGGHGGRDAPAREGPVAGHVEAPERGPRSGTVRAALLGDVRPPEGGTAGIESVAL